MQDLIRKAAAALVSISMLAPAFAVSAEKVTGAEDEASQPVTATMKPISSDNDSGKASSSEPFSDIGAEQYEWAAPFIEEMAKKGYITGYDDGTFRPDNDVTRLEGLALFSRAMGSNKEVNKPILEFAHEQYDDMLKNYTLSWGSDEIVYLLYKGALQKSDLDTYLIGAEKNKPMKRYEAAIIITKAMGGEKEATADLGVDLSYSDANTIPSNAIQYVFYATDNGIMKGLEDGSFSPEMSVSRSQMAVMLSRTVDKTGYSFAQVKLEDVDADIRKVFVKDADGNRTSYVYDDNTVVRVMGEDAQMKDIQPGVQAVITLAKNKLVALETISSEPDQTITGTYKSTSSSGGVVSITFIPSGETASKKYECTKDVSVYFEGSPATLRSFTEGAYLTLELVNGKIAVVRGEAKTITVKNATVESLDIDEKATLTISHGDKEYDGQTYVISDNVSVTKNNVKSDLRSIYSGDLVTLTIEYGVIKKIEAVAKIATVEGTIKAITISSSPSITVNVNGKDNVYDVTADVDIKINGEEGKLSDFSVGDTVKITTESNAVKKIVAESVKETSGSAVGVVTGVNTSYKVITIRTDNGNVMQFQCPDSGKSNTAYITHTGTIKKMTDIKAEQSVEVKYSISNGVYVATLVIILSE